MHVRRQDQPSGGDRPEQVQQIGLVGGGELGIGLGAEVLHDHFLDVTMFGVEVADRQQRVQPLLAGFADADQDAGGERHGQFAGQAQCFKAHRRVFVGRAVVDAAGPAEGFAGGFEHDPLAGRDFAQGGDLLAGHDTGIDVREE